jgi:hypothetical protein
MRMKQPPRTDTAWRRAHRVLVAEASALGMIAAIRSLGRAGYEIHACSSDPHALGMRSRFAARGEVHPAYDDRRFLAWLLDYVDRHSISAILPSEGFLIAIRPIYDRIAPLMVYRCFSKFEVLEHFQRAPEGAGIREHIPPSLLWRAGEPLPSGEQLSVLALPIFIKADGVRGIADKRGVVVRATSVKEAEDATRRVCESYAVVLVQGFVPGTRVVADFCMWKGEIRSRSMMIAQHESPHYGGISTLRRIAWLQDVWDDAERKLRWLGWEGIAMMEYRRDRRTGQFHFLEINARYWTGLHVEIGSGIDIPVLQMDAFFGRPQPAPDPRRKPIRYRYTVPGEIGYLRSLLRDPAVSMRRKVWAILEFFLLGLDPRVKSDLSFPGDRRLNLLAWYRYFSQLRR